MAQLALCIQSRCHSKVKLFHATKFNAVTRNRNHLDRQLANHEFKSDIGDSWIHWKCVDLSGLLDLQRQLSSQFMPSPIRAISNQSVFYKLQIDWRMTTNELFGKSIEFHWYLTVDVPEWSARSRDFAPGVTIVSRSSNSVIRQS